MSGNAEYKADTNPGENLVHGNDSAGSAVDRSSKAAPAPDVDFAADGEAAAVSGTGNTAAGDGKGPQSSE